MQRVTYHAVRPISWGLCWSSSLSHMILQPEVSTHSRDSVQFPYVFGIYLGCADATAGDPRVAPAQRGHPSPTERPPGVEAADPRRREHRSEEHTSELQSPCNLVCRLLLEKKKELRQSC